MAGRRSTSSRPTSAQYLLYTTDRQFLVNGGKLAAPSDATDLDGAAAAEHGFTFTNAGQPLGARRHAHVPAHEDQGLRHLPGGGRRRLRQPHAGVTSYQEVRGYVDAHTHGMAFEFLGGDAHCGKPWDRFGAPYALVDCPDHVVTGGYGGVLEDALSGKPHHDPVGWPTFKDWPAPNSLTHEGTYYKWLERSWRGGQRIFVNLLVENNQLCMLYPIKRNSCDDMDSVRLQAHDMYKMQDYIDAQFGGPGKGFYRIVKSPFQARKVINAGKMAVVMGIETSVPFGCTMKLDVPTCSISDIDRQLDEVRKLGVRQMELVNKFDNALAGVAGDTGDGRRPGQRRELPRDRVVLGHAALRAGRRREPRQEPGRGPGHRRRAAGRAVRRDRASSACRPSRCRSTRRRTTATRRGLTTLGEHTIKALAQRHMIFDPDHMSVKARSSALDTIDELGYHGVVSSHSWATPDAYPRIYQEGGFITPYAGDSTGFVDKWRTPRRLGGPALLLGHRLRRRHERPRRAGQPARRRCRQPGDVPVQGHRGRHHPRQTAGQRTWDINTDGVAQYGLYPDWIQDLAKVAGAQSAADGRNITEDMTRGPEAYLQMWERAEGIEPDSCRNPSLRRQVSAVSRLIHPGMSTRAVMNAVGQPYTRLGRTFGFCAKEQGPPDGADDRDVHAGREGRLAASRPLTARGRHPAQGRHRHGTLEAGDGEQEPVPTHAADLGVLDRTVGALHDRAPLHLGQRTALGTERRVHVAPPGHSCSRPRASRRRADTRPGARLGTAAALSGRTLSLRRRRCRRWSAPAGRSIRRPRRT